MSIARHKQFKIFKTVFYILELTMLLGLVYLIYEAFVNEEIPTILVIGIVILINLFIILIRRQCLLERNKQEEIFQNIIHDIKTPLHSILGFVELSKLKLKQIEENQNLNIEYNNDMIEGVSKNLDIIAKEAARLIHMSKAILNLTKLDMEKGLIDKKNFAVGELMCETLTLLESLCNQKKLNYKVEIENEEVLILADKEKLIQVIYNLIANSAKYTDSGYINCGCFKKDSNMVFYIKDTGCGIQSGDKRVFERFYTNYRMSGNGIGLAICKDIVNMHNGKIWFESELNIGTTFFFSIPIK